MKIVTVLSGFNECMNAESFKKIVVYLLVETLLKKSSGYFSDVSQIENDKNTILIV